MPWCHVHRLVMTSAHMQVFENEQTISLTDGCASADCTELCLLVHRTAVERDKRLTFGA
jgi:hypothetical protein